jgi:hypothetical protein
MKHQLLTNLDSLEYHILLARIRNLQQRLEEDESDVSSDEDDEDEDLTFILPPTLPTLPTPFLSDVKSDELETSSESIDSTDAREAWYRDLLEVIRALRDEI